MASTDVCTQRDKPRQLAARVIEEARREEGDDGNGGGTREGELVRFIELRKGPSSIVWLTADVQNKRVGAGVHVLLT